MKVDYTRGALGVALCAVVSLPVFAQQVAPQTPGVVMPTSVASSSSCAQNSQTVSRGIDVLSARIEEARQTNDAAKMRAAVADLAVALAQMKTQLADCTSLTQAGSGTMGNMPGMDHSKMPMPTGAPVMQPGLAVPVAEAKATAPMAGMDHSKMPMPSKPATAAGSGAPAPSAKTAAPMAGMDHSKMPMPPKPAAAPAARGSAAGAKAGAPAPMDHSKMAGAPAAKTNPTEPSKMAGMDHSKMAGEKAAQAPAVVFTLRTDPAPLRMGKNDLEVSVKDAEGKPIVDAEVSLAFYMPPMTSKMPEMRNAVKLTSAGNGTYKGSSTLGRAGDWDVTVTASRNGQQLDVKKMKLTVK